MYESNEVNALWQQKHILLRIFERKEITEDEFNSQIAVIDEKIKSINAEILGTLREKSKRADEEAILRRNEKMAEEKVKKEKTLTERKPRGPKKDSRGAVIIEVLQMKSVKDMTAAVDRVVEKMPGQNPKNVRAQISAIISLVKKQKGRFAGYSWDDTTFQLTSKN